MKVADFFFTAFTYAMGVGAFVAIVFGFVNVILGNVISF